MIKLNANLNQTFNIVFRGWSFTPIANKAYDAFPAIIAYVHINLKTII